MKILQPFTLALLWCLFSSAASAQMVLEKRGDGGAVPGISSFELQGHPHAPYLLLFSDREQSTPIAPGVNLDIDLFYLEVCLQIPLFPGVLDGSGAATPSIPIPREPLLIGMTLSFQSFELEPLGEVSNLTRVTYQEPETFASTLDALPLPLVTGSGFLQADGKVLLLGGSGPVVQEYDPDFETFRVAGVVPSGNVLATQTRLGDGTILVCGGLGLNGQPVDEAFVFDPSTGLATVVGAMSTPRAGHAAALLRDGRVLVVGGAASFDFQNLPAFLAGIQRSSEFYDPTLRAFTPGPSLLEQKMFHSATTLGNGDVLVAGGLSVVPILNVPIVSPTAQSYSAALNIFGLPSLMAKPRMLHGACVLDNGRALLAGGVTIDFSTFLQTQNPLDLAIESVDDAVTYRPGFFGGFSASMPLSSGRLLPALAPLSGTRALIAGGFELNLSAQLGTLQFRALPDSDLFAGGSVRATAAMNAARVGAVAVTLRDGTVLVAGGGPLQSEIYQPR